MTRRRETQPSTDESERRQRERRDDSQRFAIEMLLDRFFRPSRWAARGTHALGLQGLPVAVSEHVIEAPCRPVRIAFASDFHAGATTDVRVLEAACAVLNDVRADIVLLGGDFVSVRADDIYQLAPLLADVHAPFGKFGVFGNHDLRANYPIVGAALERAGVRMLRNEVVQLTAPHNDVSIIGIDDTFLGEPDASVLDHAQGVRIVLMHEPDGLLVIGERHFDVAFCGHTHGGQIVLPGSIKPYLPHGELSRTYAGGEYQLGQRKLIVSRGVGCSTIPIRMGCHSEVHALTLRNG